MFMQRFLCTASTQCLIRAVCVICFSACGASTASAETIAPRPHHAVWPIGWEVSYLPAPKTDSGETFTASEENYVRCRQQFDAVKQSIVFK